MAYGADKEKAKTPEELIARLAGGFAHDLKNLLTPILAYGDMVRHEMKDNAMCREYLDEIMRAGERTLALAQRLQSLGAHRASLQAVPLKDIVAELAASISDESGTRIEVATGEDPGRARADPALVERIFRELAQNALDAVTGGGKIIVSVAAQRVAAGAPDVPAGDYIVLTVKDDGAGMSPAVLDRLFEPYFSTKEKAPGRGLGLASVRAMVRQCEGYLRIESVPGRGTEARIFFMRAEA